MVKKKTFKKYTKKEDEVLLKCIQESGNVFKGCTLAAGVLKNRTRDALATRCYTVLVKEHPVIIDVIKKHRKAEQPAVVVKKKACKKAKKAEKPAQFLYVMKKMLELSVEERTKIIDFFKK